MRQQLCALSIEQLNELSARLDELSDSIMQPGIRGDLQQARFAIQDLASIRFGVEEIAAATVDFTTATELRSLIGKAGER
jgi:hypothetical protein